MVNKADEFGEFIDGGRGYKITTQFPPRQMTNKLYNKMGYMSELTHWGTGGAYFKFTETERNTIVPDDAKTLYCRNEVTGKVWNPGVYPMMSEVTDYSCIHHDAYTEISSLYDGIRITWRIFVPLDAPYEIWTVKVDNTTNEEKSISLVPATKMKLSGFKATRFFEGQGSVSYNEYRDDINGMYYYAKNPWPKNKRYNAVLSSSEPVTSYCGDFEDFAGTPLNFSYPMALINKKDLGNKKGHGVVPFFSIQSEIKILGNQSKIVDFLFGVVESVNEAVECVDVIKNDSNVSRENSKVEILFNETVNDIENRRKRLIVNTPVQKINYFVNTWLKKGLEYCLHVKAATRDNMQFADGICMTDPDRVREEILMVLKYQYSDGHTVRSWMPKDDVYYCDGPLWLVMTTCGYLKFSDDIELLDEIVPYYDGGEGTVREHLEKCIQRIDEDRGTNNLPLIRYADWNDALNLTDPKAESVFMAMAFGYMLKEMSQLMCYIGDNKAQIKYEKMHAELKETINDVAWNEETGYYVRAFSNGEVIGGPDSEGSTIFVNPQSWAILGDIVTKERLPRILKAVDTLIDTEIGCPVNVPAFTNYKHEYGRISAQFPGTSENGSVYCHATSFKTAADVLVGRGDTALNSIMKILPDSENNPATVSGATPYAMTSSFNTDPYTWGKAGRPWLTGTQCWTMRTVVEGLLGVRRAYGGISINPSFPTSWDKASVVIKRKDAEYKINILRNKSSNSKLQSNEVKVTMNNQVIENAFIPFKDSGIYEVTVHIG